MSQRVYVAVRIALLSCIRDPNKSFYRRLSFSPISYIHQSSHAADIKAFKEQTCIQIRFIFDQYP